MPEDRVEHVELAAFFDGGHDPLLIGPPVPAAPRHERQTTINPDMPDREDRAVEANRAIKGVIDLKSAIEGAGLTMDIVSTGETWSYDVAAEIPGVTSGRAWRPTTVT